MCTPGAVSLCVCARSEWTHARQTRQQCAVSRVAVEAEVPLCADDRIRTCCVALLSALAHG